MEIVTRKMINSHWFQQMVATGLLFKHSVLKWGETKVRVREYNQVATQREECLYQSQRPSLRDGQRKREVRVVGTRVVTRLQGRKPPPTRFETWVTVSLGKYTACGQNRTDALRELYRLLKTN